MFSYSYLTQVEHIYTFIKLRFREYLNEQKINIFFGFYIQKVSLKPQTCFRIYIYRNASVAVLNKRT